MIKWIKSFFQPKKENERVEGRDPVLAYKKLQREFKYLLKKYYPDIHNKYVKEGVYRSNRFLGMSKFGLTIAVCQIEYIAQRDGKKVIKKRT